MIIKHPALTQHLQKRTLPALYVLPGQEHYLLEQCAQQIYAAINVDGDVEKQRISVQQSDDWKNVIAQAQCYSLFSAHTLIDVRFDKKSIDKPAQTSLQQYLANPNTHCTLILWTPHVPIKQLQWLVSNQQAFVIQITPLPPHSMQQWIKTTLQQQGIQFEPDVPLLIQQYTLGHQMACAQAIERIALLSDIDKVLTLAEVKDLLVDQSQYALYELTEACLAGQAGKALHILQRQMSDAEPTLILWLLTQEIRQLIGLALCCRSMTFSAACQQLKIWSQKMPLYATALKRHSNQQRHALLSTCQQLDHAIKSNTSLSVWRDIEQLILKLSLQDKSKSSEDIKFSSSSF